MRVVVEAHVRRGCLQIEALQVMQGGAAGPLGDERGEIVVEREIAAVSDEVVVVMVIELSLLPRHRVLERRRKREAGKEERC